MDLELSSESEENPEDIVDVPGNFYDRRFATYKS